MHEALVQDAEDDVDGDQRGEDEEAFVRERTFEGGCGSLVVGDDALGEVGVFDDLVDGVECLAERVAGGEVERDGDRRKLALVIDREGFAGFGEVGERAEGNRIGDVGAGAR